MLLFFLPKGWFQPVILSIPTMSVMSGTTTVPRCVPSMGKLYYAFETKLDVEVKANARNIRYGQVQFVRGDEVKDADTVRAILALQ